VINQLRVDKVIGSADLSELTESTPLLTAIQNKRIPYYQAHADHFIKFKNGLQIDFLYPSPEFAKTQENENNHSLVVHLTYGRVKFLLTGDIEQEVEEALLANNDRLTSNVLKVAHHGSKSSSSVQFVNAVKPHYAVISVGKNLYGHPAAETITTLQHAGAKVLRTDYCGAITFKTNGENLTCETYLAD